jgi:hypothetical protein
MFKAVYLAVVVISAAFSSAVSAQEFQAQLTERTIRVTQERLVAMIGKDATDAAKVFAIPVERFEAMAQTPDSGVVLSTTTFPIGGSRARVDGVGPKKDMYVLIDYQRGVSYLVKPDAKTYVELSPGLSDGPARTPGPASLKRLNQTARIHGQDTTAYDIKSDLGTARVWVSAAHKELAKFYQQVRAATPKLRADGGNLRELSTAMSAEHGTPIRLQLFDENGYTIVDLVSVEKKTFPADTFTIPAGFQKAGAPG